MQKLSSESWNVLGDVYLDAFHCCGDFLVFEVQLFILDYNRSIVLNATLEYYPDRVKGTKSENLVFQAAFRQINDSMHRTR